MTENKSKESVKKENPHKGHRIKVRQRYYENGFNGMPDHNVLEMLLFYGIPYRDTNEMAHELISRFGSFSGVFEADFQDLVSVKGITENAACLITMILPLYKRYISDINSRKPYNESKKSLAEYIRSFYLDTTNERIYALAYDGSRRFICCSCIGEGDIVSTGVDLRKLSSFVLSTKATGIIITHNHPHGITSPSLDDIDTTKFVYKFLESLKVRLLDHIIVNETDYLSMAETLKYAYIFSGVENSPFDSDIDAELEYTKELLAEKKRQESIDRAHKIVEQARKNKTEH